MTETKTNWPLAYRNILDDYTQKNVRDPRLFALQDAVERYKKDHPLLSKEEAKELFLAEVPSAAV